ncbi:prepilin peptidase [Acerihabitans arboris]|uniref:Prepilin peptidase n=1 Tax=Acerihabitans arboris TaxID=2691583 RepID=A0A845SNX6_9GAMM|nr:A24 family peptidase [Acerihabitans arboris]NDL64281.1 prepilin peptidase [Acerihabitans arboris]
MTLVTLIGPWQLALPVFYVALVVVRSQIRTVAALMVVYGHPRPAEPGMATVKRHTWLHAGAMTVTVMLSSAVQPFELMSAVLFVILIFRMSLIDRLAGWLPKEFTVYFLLAGLLVAIGKGDLLHPAFTSLGILLAGVAIRVGSKYYTGREALGLGDVWLMTGLGAWLGFSLALFALSSGVVGFALWYAGAREMSHGGPLGPWLGYSALLAMSVSLSNPLLVW